MAENIPIGNDPNLSPSNPIPQEGVGSQEEPSESGFDHLVNQTGANRNPSKPSPLSMAQNSSTSMQSSKPSPESLMSNINLLMGQMQNLQGALQTPNLKLNPRTKRLLDAKLKRTKDHINFVSGKVNVGDEDGQKGQQQKPDQKDAIKEAKGDNKSHIDKFVGYITDGQAQLESVMHQVSHLSKDKNKPGLMMQDMFAMQVKLYRAQVEVEFSTAVLQKGIDDLKTIMSVQL